MTVFKDTDHMYDVLGGLWKLLFNQDENDRFVEFLNGAGLGPEDVKKYRDVKDHAIKKFYDSGLTVKFSLTEPDGVIWVLHGEDRPKVVLGNYDAKPDVEMILSGDNAHKFWCKSLSIPIALATRKIRTKGPVTKVLGLLPLVNPIFDLYPKYCKVKGIPV